jgi:hypothetical protein
MGRRHKPERSIPQGAGHTGGRVRLDTAPVVFWDDNGYARNHERPRSGSGAWRAAKHFWGRVTRRQLDRELRAELREHPEETTA